MAEDETGRGFKVVDKRSFDREGHERDESPKGESAEEAKGEEQTEAECAEPGATESMPGVDFMTFILSLHNSAACLLGKAPYPDTGTCAVNLPMAKQTIDIIGMLQDKTKGNLTGEEERFLSEILYDLRVAYVQASK